MLRAMNCRDLPYELLVTTCAAMLLPLADQGKDSSTQDVLTAACNTPCQLLLPNTCTTHFST